MTDKQLKVLYGKIAKLERTVAELSAEKEELLIDVQKLEECITELENDLDYKEEIISDLENEKEDLQSRLSDIAQLADVGF